MIRTCQHCGSSRKLADGNAWYECRDIQSRVKVVLSIHRCKFWRKKEHRP